VVGLVLGSVTLRLLHVAPCPVLVVPAVEHSTHAAEGAGLETDRSTGRSCEGRYKGRQTPCSRVCRCCALPYGFELRVSSDGRTCVCWKDGAMSMGAASRSAENGLRRARSVLGPSQGEGFGGLFGGGGCL
jgi:hypothetical protein